MLIRNADIFGKRRDVRLKAGRIETIAPSLDGHADIDAQGGALVPGLHDHHIHLNALAASLTSVRCGPPEVADESDLIERLRAVPGEIRGIGYHGSVAGAIDRDWLDGVVADRPLRIQHRSGRLWIMNSAALDLYDIKSPDGRLLDYDVHLSRRRPPDLAPVTDALIARGVTGVTEVTPSNGVAEFARYQALPMRVCVMGRPELTRLEDARVGPVKLHYHDYNLPALDALSAEMAEAHDAGRAVASHCVTRAELMLTLAALEAVGPRPGDRIEHGAIIDEAALDWMFKLGVTVVSQPNFLTERQTAYRLDVPREDHAHLWRLKGLLTRDIPVALGTDAPFGHYDPWAAMDAAVNRPKGFGEGGVSPETALALFTKPWNDASARPRQITGGAVADLCLLDRPWLKARQSLTDVGVKATWVNGRLLTSRPS